MVKKAKFNQVEHLRAAGVKGGKAVFAKYGQVGGDPQKRKEAWRKWWEKIGRHQNSKILYKRKKIKYPRYSTKLAEFVGIMLGDGGISHWQATVTLNSETDKEYAVFVAHLMRTLFGIQAQFYDLHPVKAVNVVLSSTELTDYLQRLGLVIGNKIKQKVDIPNWIKKNPAYALVCLRGLVDTDGSVFNHRYRVGGKQYSYKKLDFCSLSKPLLRSAYDIFRANGMHPYIAQGKKLRLESKKDIRQYFEVIGTSNPKHLRRYKN